MSVNRITDRIAQLLSLVLSRLQTFPSRIDHCASCEWAGRAAYRQKLGAVYDVAIARDQLPLFAMLLDTDFKLQQIHTALLVAPTSNINTLH